MNRWFRVLCLILALVSSNALPMSPALTAYAEEKEVTVYVTRTGAKYHRGTCRYLNRSKIPIALGQAAKSYSPCSVCRPPRAE